MLILCKVFYELSAFILIFWNLQMDCTRSRLIRVIGLCKENVTNKQIAGIIQANIVPSNNHSEASDEWVFVHCCLVFMIITLVSSLLVSFTHETIVHTQWPSIMDTWLHPYLTVTHVNSTYNKEQRQTSDAYQLYNWW